MAHFFNSAVAVAAVPQGVRVAGPRRMSVARYGLTSDSPREPAQPVPGRLVAGGDVRASGARSPGSAPPSRWHSWQMGSRLTSGRRYRVHPARADGGLSLIHISEPTRRTPISY